MYSQDAFLASIQNYLSVDTSGALMITGAWGSGKTYYVSNILEEKLKSEGKFPIKISLFGLSNLDDLEKRITEIFLQEYSEDNLIPTDAKNNKVFAKIAKTFSSIKLSKGTQKTQSLADMVPFIGQYIAVSRIIDAYTALCLTRLPKDKIVLIFDDLERSVKTIRPHLLLGVINDLVETKKYKVILIANDSYFNKGSRSYLDFKEKVIERTLLFPPDIINIYKALIHQHELDFEQLMSKSEFIAIIDPNANVNTLDLDIQENLSNIRIIKFAINNYAMIVKALKDVANANLDNSDLQEYLLSLWALTVGLSIEYKRNRITYLNRDAFICAASVESFAIDIDDSEPSLFGEPARKDAESSEMTAEKVRDILKNYIERHTLPLVTSVQVFDLVTAGINIDAIQMNQHWEKYHLQRESLKQNPALVLLNRFMMSIDSFTNEDFLGNLQLLAKYTKQGDFPDDVSYINAATFLQHYAGIISKTHDEIKDIIKKGVDEHYSHVKKLPILAKSNLSIISSEIPEISKWVVEYINAKIEEQAERENNDDIQEAIRQFREDLPTLARRLMPDMSSHSTPDFFSYPILSKIPLDIIVDKLKNIQPSEVMAIGSILNSRFVNNYTKVSFPEESVFIQNLQRGVEIRGDMKTLADYLISDHLQPILKKLIANIPQKAE
mgnify:FL=1